MQMETSRTKTFKKDPKKVYYQTKLVVTFKDSNYAAILPNIKWFKQLVQENGKTIALYKPWFNTNVTEKRFVKQTSIRSVKNIL